MEKCGLGEMRHKSESQGTIYYVTGENGAMRCFRTRAWGRGVETEVRVISDTEKRCDQKKRCSRWTSRNMTKDNCLGTPRWQPNGPCSFSLPNAHHKGHLKLKFQVILMLHKQRNIKVTEEVRWYEACEHTIIEKDKVIRQIHLPVIRRSNNSGNVHANFLPKFLEHDERKAVLLSGTKFIFLSAYTLYGKAFNLLSNAHCYRLKVYVPPQICMLKP